MDSLCQFCIDLYFIMITYTHHPTLKAIVRDFIVLFHIVHEAYHHIPSPSSPFFFLRVSQLFLLQYLVYSPFIFNSKVNIQRDFLMYHRLWVYFGQFNAICWSPLLLLRASRSKQTWGILIWDFQPLELLGNKNLLQKSTHFLVLCNRSPRELIRSLDLKFAIIIFSDQKMLTITALRLIWAPKHSINMKDFFYSKLI
jgi:hypothetical protein